MQILDLLIDTVELSPTKTWSCYQHFIDFLSNLIQLYFQKEKI